MSEAPDNQGPPWCIKSIQIELGNQSDEWLVAKIFADSSFSLSIQNVFSPDLQPADMREITVEEMDMCVARMLRDFLIYAIPCADSARGG